jgi:hypothetical protein
MRTPTAQVTRCIVVLTLVAAAALAGCRDQPVAGPRTHSIQPPLQPTKPSFDLGDPQTVTVPVASSDGSGSVYMTTRYSQAIYATVTFSGLITQQQNYVPHNSLQYGPAGLQGACQGLLRIDFDSGGGSWWPSTGCTPGSQITSSWTTQIGVKGLGHVSRGAGPTACDSAPPCYTYSGTQTVSITPATVGLAETVNQSIANPGTTLAFTASPTGYLPSHTYWGITEWRWIPDVGSQSVQCVGWGDVCYYAPSGSGTMQVTGTMNGVVRTASVRVIVQCAIAGSTADSAFLRIANDTLTRKLLKPAWDSSGTTGSAANRREHIGFWGFDTAGHRMMDFKADTVGSTPCQVSYSPHGMQFINILWVVLHIHPFAAGDLTPLSCHPDIPFSRYDYRSQLGVSGDDFYFLQGYYPQAWGVMVDMDGVVVYQTPPSMTFKYVGTPPNGYWKVTSDWTPYTRRYPRHQAACDVY